MEEKIYETYAKQVQLIVHQHRQEAEKIGQAVQKVNADPRYSQQGKDELIAGLRAELKELNKTKTDELKAIVTKFCNQYQVIHTDEEADEQKIANALKIIEMCGYNLTPELLRSAVEPLKNSYSALKMLRSLLDAKNGNGGQAFTPQVLILMDDYIGVNMDIMSYEDAFESVKETLDMPELLNAGIVGTPELNGQVVNRLVDMTCYSVLILGDNMMKVGKLYDTVYLEYPRLFK